MKSCQGATNVVCYADWLVHNCEGSLLLHSQTAAVRPGIGSHSVASVLQSEEEILLIRGEPPEEREAYARELERLKDRCMQLHTYALTDTHVQFVNFVVDLLLAWQGAALYLHNMCKSCM